MSTKRNLILIGKAEEIDLLTPPIRKMVENEGLYIGGDTKTPNVIIPLWSSGGKVYSMKIDAELDPERFLPTLILAGPYLPPKP